MAKAQIMSLAPFSIMPGQSVEKIFRLGHSSYPLSLVVHADPESNQLALMISEVGNGSRGGTIDPLVNTSFIREFTFNFTPKMNSLYKVVITNHGLESVETDIEILYLVPVEDKLENTRTQNIKIMIFFVVIFVSLLLTATIMKYGIMGKNKHDVKVRRPHRQF